MSIVSRLLWVLLLLPGAGWAAVLPGLLAVQASPRRGVVGQPVTITFQVNRPAGKIVFWNLTDRAFRSVTLLKAETCAVPASASQHTVVFTATQGGLCELGPFAVTLRDWQGADTLYAPAVRVQFRAEALRSRLHPLRGIVARQPGLGAAQLGGWGVVGLLCSGLGAGWLLRKKLKKAAPARVKALSPAQTQRLALARLAALEQAVQASSVPLGKLPDQLFGIVNECLAQLPEPAAVDKVALAELAQARFAPAQAGEHGAARLLAQAKKLVAGWKMPPQPTSQRV